MPEQHQVSGHAPRARSALARSCLPPSRSLYDAQEPESHPTDGVISTVPSDEHSSRAHRLLSKNRMEGFSDGVFGFAITLLVLDIALGGTTAQPALDRVLLGWPTYLAYLVSFLTIGATWLGHTAMTDQLNRVDSILLRLNLLLLMVVVFLPFPTHLVAEYLDAPSSERVFVTMYGLTLLVIRVLHLADLGPSAPHQRRAEERHRIVV